MGDVLGIVVKIAWSATRWRGVSEEEFERQRHSGFRFVAATGYGHEDWNFSEDLDNEYYYGFFQTHIKPTQFLNRQGFIFFVSRNPEDRKYYFVGFYGNAEFLPAGYDTKSPL